MCGEGYDTMPLWNDQLCSKLSAAVSTQEMHASRSHILEDSCLVAITEFGCPALIVATASHGQVLFGAQKLMLIRAVCHRRHVLVW